MCLTEKKVINENMPLHNQVCLETDLQSASVANFVRKNLIKVAKFTNIEYDGRSW